MVTVDLAISSWPSPLRISYWVLCKAMLRKTVIRWVLTITSDSWTLKFLVFYLMHTKSGTLGYKSVRQLNSVMSISQSKYRLDDESRWLRDLDHCGNWKFRCPERVTSTRASNRFPRWSKSRSHRWFVVYWTYLDYSNTKIHNSTTKNKSTYVLMPWWCPYLSF